METGHTSQDSTILRDYCDGSEFAIHPLFELHKNGLQIQLYYDDVEMCNPLGSSRKKHKVGKYVIIYKIAIM